MHPQQGLQRIRYLKTCNNPLTATSTCDWLEFYSPISPSYIYIYMPPSLHGITNPSATKEDATLSSLRLASHPQYKVTVSFKTTEKPRETRVPNLYNNGPSIESEPR